MRFLFVLVVALLIPTFGVAAETATKKSKKTSTQNRGLVVVEKNRDGRKRVALVIGNSNYRYTDSMPKLTNPTNDAEDMAATLKRFGFEVIAKKNLTKEEMDETITDFGRRITDSDAALFYYAGHGLQVKGQNYMVPVDANIDSEAKVPYRAVNVNQLLEEMDSSRSRVNIVMLDACRNNPISGKFRSGTTRGLAPPATMPKGTVIVYATDPGNVSADGNGRNGLFTAGLLTAFKGNDLTLGGVLYAASKQVQNATNQQQTPYINGPATVQREFSFISPSGMTDLQLSTVQPEPTSQTPPKAKPSKPTSNNEAEGASTKLQNEINDILEQAKKGDSSKLPRLRELAKQGNAVAQGALSLIYSNGWGVNIDYVEALLWSRNAAELGNGAGQNVLAWLYSEGQVVAKDDAEAVRWYRKAAEQGYADAQYNLGVRYDNGQGIAKDEAEAVKWHLQAAEQGFAMAQTYLGVMYANGQGIAKDETEAAKWYRKAAEQGYANGQYNLGVMYDNGRGVAKDEVEAVKWLRKAAEQGFAMAQTYLGVMYANGQGIAKDETEAAKWYRKAAEQGYANGQYNLGVMYDNGRGVAKDEVEAVKWYRKAAEQGYAKAINNLKILGQ